ncbi:MAG TPA: hypothetical protein VHA52_05780, partial [Candidatus Babeliaceae bacterium]|nr:hypothetical protein [Candidatus Babeliaceae bacterium]
MLGIHKIKPGTIILLNGPSAAGKSTTQKKLQDLLKEPYLKMGIDRFFVGVIPERYFKGPLSDMPIDNNTMMEGVSAKDAQGNPLFVLKIGDDGQRVISGMHHAFASYAKAGNNLIVDYILYYEEWIPELVNALKGLRVYMIGIKPSLAILEEREKLRGTSPIGHARSHYDTVHNGMIYDLELDTSSMTADEAALKIKEFLE